MHLPKFLIVLFFLLFPFCSTYSQMSCMNETINDSLIKYLISIKEIDTIFSKDYKYYRDAIYVVPITEFIDKENHKQIGVYRFGTNSDHGKEYVFILNAKIEILSGTSEDDIYKLINFFEGKTSYFNNENILFCLKKVLEIMKENKSSKIYQLPEPTEK